MNYILINDFMSKHGFMFTIEDMLFSASQISDRGCTMLLFIAKKIINK